MNRLKNIFQKRRYTPIKLTIKAVIRWEQLNKKTFSHLNLEHEDEVLSLFYVCTLSNQSQFTLEEFKISLSASDAKRMVKDFKKQISLTSQFQLPSKNKSKESADSNPPYIKDIVGMLVMNGLDAYFAINDMELCDLPVFLSAYDQKVKDQLTAQRLWAFMQLSPHLEKGTKPQDIYPFAWELEEETISEEEMEKGKSESITFLKTGLKK